MTIEPSLFVQSGARSRTLSIDGNTFGLNGIEKINNETRKNAPDKYSMNFLYIDFLEPMQRLAYILQVHESMDI